MFVIVQVRCCPALMVPVASIEPGAVCMQSPEKVTLRIPKTALSTIVKVPGPDVTSWLLSGLRLNVDGWGLLPPVISTLNSSPALGLHGGCGPGIWNITQNFSN